MCVTRTGLVGAVIFAVLLQSGCSFMFVKGPPAKHAEKASFECSESNAVPVIDAIWAALNGLGAASAANDDQLMNRDQVVKVGLTWLAVSGISAIYGFSKVSRCKDAKRLRDERYERYESERKPASASVSAPAASGDAPAPGPVAPAASEIAPVRTAPAAAPAPPAAAPASEASETTPVPLVAPGSTSSIPTTSRSPSHSLLPAHLAVRSAPLRALAMRPALAAD